MTQAHGRERVLILVKALPHVGKKYGETVCCAGVTAEGQWRRQFPVRFRHLQDKFKRWQWVEYSWRQPRSDRRIESRHVQEDSIHPANTLPVGQRSRFLNPLVVPSTQYAEERGLSLALIRPRDIRFSWRKKSSEDIELDREAYAEASRQFNLFDDELRSLEPCPYAFLFSYVDDSGTRHENTCEDWETAAMFYKGRSKYGEADTLARMDNIFNEEYPKKGVVFAMGTHSRFPQTWLLIGVIRLNHPDQPSLL